MDGRSQFCRDMRCVNDVLDADRDAVQWTLVISIVPLARLRERLLAIEERPCLNRFFAFVDPVEAGLNQKLTGDLA